MSGVDALRALRAAERKLSGARYDLTRQDKHPNDVHKAEAKIIAAERLIVEAREQLEGAKAVTSP